MAVPPEIAAILDEGMALKVRQILLVGTGAERSCHIGGIRCAGMPLPSGVLRHFGSEADGHPIRSLLLDSRKSQIKDKVSIIARTKRSKRWES